MAIFIHFTTLAVAHTPGIQPESTVKFENINNNQLLREDSARCSIKQQLDTCSFKTFEIVLKGKTYNFTERWTLRQHQLILQYHHMLLQGNLLTTKHM